MDNWGIRKIIGILSAAVLLLVFSVVLLGNKVGKTEPEPKPTATQILAEKNNDYFSYEGVADKDALTLLKEKTTVTQDKTGMVVSINGRLADPDKNEYWAFYINKNLAPVGPSSYKTKSGDLIEWKIEKF